MFPKMESSQPLMKVKQAKTTKLDTQDQLTGGNY